MLATLKRIKDLFLQKLDFLLEKQDNLLRKQDSLFQRQDNIVQRQGNTDASIKSLLKSSIHVVERQNQLLQSQMQIVSNQSLDLQQQEVLRQQVNSLKQQFETRLNRLEAQLEEVLKILASMTDYQSEGISVGEPRLDAEVGLMSFLYSYLPNRVAIDIGANKGDIAEQLLKSGFEVYAFEPFQPIFAQLQQRLSRYSHFHAFDCAIGVMDGERTLHIAEDLSGEHKYENPTLYSTLTPHSTMEDLQFTQQVNVSVRSLDSLHHSAEIPSEVGLVKIDTEGADLEVIRGMGDRGYPVVVSEYWDASHPFGASSPYKLPDLVKEMRQRQYHWFIVIYHRQLHDAGFYCNVPQSIQGTWGNVFFFQDHAIFSQALHWCDAVLPKTYFNG